MRAAMCFSRFSRSVGLAGRRDDDNDSNDDDGMINPPPILLESSNFIGVK